MSAGLQEELIALLGREAFLRLAEALGGQRLYVQRTMENDRLQQALGPEGAQLLQHRYEGEYLEVPLARDLIARHYRLLGESDGQIAGRLRMTLSGVRKLFRRQPKRAPSGPRGPDPRQGTLL